MVFVCSTYVLPYNPPYQLILLGMVLGPSNIYLGNCPVEGCSVAILSILEHQRPQASPFGRLHHSPAGNTVVASQLR